MEKYTIRPGKLTHYRPALKCNNLGIFQSLKFRILMEKILLISLNLNFSPNTLGCYGLKTKGEGKQVYYYYYFHTRNIRYWFGYCKVPPQDSVR